VARDSVIGKAQRRKALMEEWTRRRDRPCQDFSDASYSMSKEMGDVPESHKRRTRRRAPLWLSDAALKFGHPVEASAPLGPVLNPIWTTWSRSEYK
jgi:hypothetical protein